MYKKLLVFLLVCLVVSYADDANEVARKKKHIKLLFGGGVATYLTFLAIKLKIIFVIGTLIAIALIVGKVFLLLKYGAGLWEKKIDDTIVFTDPHGHHGGWGGSGVTFDAPPTYYNSDHPHSDASGGSYEHYERSIGNSILENINMMKQIFNRMDLTEYAFDSMEVKGDDCKKRFVCEADIHGSKNSLLALGLYMFSETGFSKYRNKTPISMIEDCERLNPDCKHT